MQLSLFESPQRTKPTGEQLRDEGIAKAAEHAGDEWQQQALGYVRTFPRDELKTEDVRDYAYGMGLSKPPDERAWGSVITAARRLGLLVFDRYESVVSPQAHKRPASVWRRVK